MFRSDNSRDYCYAIDVSDRIVVGLSCFVYKGNTFLAKCFHMQPIPKIEQIKW